MAEHVAAEEQESVEDAKAYLTSNYFYDEEQIFQESESHSPFDDRFKLYHAFGFDLSRRYNAIPVNENIVFVTDGNYAFFLDLISGAEQLLTGHASGITCCAVHPNGEYAALGESGKNPNLLIYHYPSCRLYRMLKGGTESAFTALNFSPDGKMLAAVGTFPDYTLTVWDWEKENLILRAKAFSQDIYRVTFSDKLGGRLTTGGVGHIRFWEMARTFTGLKLQGEIGKFGNIEISDTSGYAMFPDGKVLSGSESGSLLLWEDSLVKCEFDRQGGKRCHKGMVEVVFLSGHDIITAGRDGVIRVWDFTTIDTAETEDTSNPIDLAMKFKLRVAKGASVKSMHRVGAGYLVVDQNGALWRVDLDNKTVMLIQHYHAGAVRAAAFSPKAPLFVTGGDDGYVRLWNIVDRSLVGELHFEAAVTRIVWVGLDTDREGLTLYVGFADGCMRVLLCSAQGLVLKQPLKPHTSAVRDIVISSLSNTVATTGDDGALFFFRAEAALVPLGFVYVNGRKPRTKEEITQAAISGVPLTDDRDYAKGLKIRWNNNNIVSVALSDGTIASVTAPTSIAESSGESFYIDIPMEVMKEPPPDNSITASLQLDDIELQGKADGTITSPTFSRQPDPLRSGHQSRDDARPALAAHGLGQRRGLPLPAAATAAGEARAGHPADHRRARSPGHQARRLLHRGGEAEVRARPSHQSGG
jgi:WD40 repeat protein